MILLDIVFLSFINFFLCTISSYFFLPLPFACANRLYMYYIFWVERLNMFCSKAYLLCIHFIKVIAYFQGCAGKGIRVFLLQLTDMIWFSYCWHLKSIHYFDNSFFFQLRLSAIVSAGDVSETFKGMCFVSFGSLYDLDSFERIDCCSTTESDLYRTCLVHCIKPMWL